MVGLIFFKIVHHCWWLLVHQEKNTWDICSKQATSAPLLLEFQTFKSSEVKIGGYSKEKKFDLSSVTIVAGDTRQCAQSFQPFCDATADATQPPVSISDRSWCCPTQGKPRSSLPCGCASAWDLWMSPNRKNGHTQEVCSFPHESSWCDYWDWICP